MKIAQINTGDFQKIILNVGDFIKKFKCNNCFINAEDPRAIPRKDNL